MVKAKPDRRKWNRWIDRISDELIQSWVEREVYEQWWKIVWNNPKVDVNNRFISLIWSSYFDRQALVVRRQVDRDRQSISLVRLLHEVANYSSHLTREAFMSSYTSPEFRDRQREGQKLFNSFTVRRGSSVSPTRVHTDIARLIHQSRGLKYLSDKWLAHSDRKRHWPKLGFRQLNKALDVLYSIWHRYHVLIRGGAIYADPKFLAGSDWQDVFDFPWR